MNVIQNLVPQSKYNIKSPFKMDAKFIVVHNTYNDAPAKNEISFMIRNNNKVSFHYAVDDKEIVQGIPDNRSAYHAGTTDGNRNGLSVEICYSESGGDRFVKAEKLASKFIAFKLNERGWGVDKVKKHQDFSGKYCPHRTLDMGWDRFIKMVQSELSKLKGGSNMVNTSKDVSAWAKESWEWAKKEGLIDGTRPKDYITREELAVVLFRINEKKGK